MPLIDRAALVTIVRALLLMAFVPSIAQAANCNVTSVGFTPLNDLGTGTYLGFEGGLYPGGGNSPPAAHAAEGMSRAQGIQPLDANGNPDPNGRYALLSIGMSNTSQEFLFGFIPLANADPDKDPNLVVVNGAQGSQPARNIIDPNATFWSNIEDRLAEAGVTANQVVVAWMKQANPANNADTTTYRNELQGHLEEIARIMLDKYPNLQILYQSSRIYAGYADTTLNPEPYAYDSGFVVKWSIESQLNGDPLLNFSPANGTVEAPLMLWGPYMWADGLIPRSDGLIWECSDLEGDGTHPSPSGEAKVGQLLLDFFKTDPIAQQWYLAQPGNVDTVPPMAPSNLIAE